VLEIHRASRADALVGALAQLLRWPPADPLAPEIVAVATRGMERWLSQQLCVRLGASSGAGDGVCANVLFPAPRQLVEGVLASASGIDPELDPWTPQRALWPLLAVLHEQLGEPWLAHLARHLGVGADSPDPARAARRLGVARHLAQLYARYALARPQMLCAWAAGRDVDGAGGVLPAQAVWQAQLWRALRRRIGAPDVAQRLEQACQRIAREPSLLDLPERVCLFGLTRISAGELRVLSALACRREVHLFVLDPSPALWKAIATARPSAAMKVMPRRADRSDRLVANDLLRSWGREARELALALGALEHRDHHHQGRFASETLLGRIQADIRANRAPPGAPPHGAPDRRPWLDPRDRSVQIHACHGRARQVEVLRDALAHAFSEDPTLQPRDVIVMCPDIEVFAPLIQASFGGWEAGDHSFGHAAGAGSGSDADGTLQLPVRLADRAPLYTNPLLGAVRALLELADRRVSASQVLDFASRDPVRRRFGLGDGDLERLQEWVADAGIRWGLDAAHRAPYRLERLAAGTWSAGLDRLLLGVAMREQRARLWQRVLPLDDVDSSAIELAGRVAELVRRLAAAIERLTAPRPIAEWAAAITAATDALTASDARQAWQRDQLERLLEQIVAESLTDGRPSPIELSLAELRWLLEDRLASTATRANFRTGQLTVCTLYPMRSVPHRVICLLGLDDGAFPRRTPADGDDLTLQEPLVGERDARSEDRQLLLDALLAATDRLLITYTGADERTNISQPPAVPVGELLDVIDATVRAAGGPARERVLVRHPLQPFDPRNFTPGALVAGISWSHDRAALEGARALSLPRSPRAPFLAEPLPPPSRDAIELDDLIDFLGHPVRAFLRQRLGISPHRPREELDDALPVELDDMQRWGVGQRLLQARLAGIEARDALLAEIARGVLPPGALSGPLIDELHRLVERIVSAWRLVVEGSPAGHATAPPTAHVRLTLPDGRLLSGTVAGCHGDLIVNCGFARVSPAQRLAAWASLVAASASAPERAFEAASIGRAREGGGVEIFRIGALGGSPERRAAAALEQLLRLVDLYDRGMREPLPIFPRTSSAYAQALLSGGDPVAAARGAWSSAPSAWSSGSVARGEDRDAAHRLVFGGVVALQQLLAQAPRPGEEGPGWPSSQTRLGRLARRLWDPVLQREQVSAA